MGKKKKNIITLGEHNKQDNTEVEEVLEEETNEEVEVDYALLDELELLVREAKETDNDAILFRLLLLKNVIGFLLGEFLPRLGIMFSLMSSGAPQEERKKLPGMITSLYRSTPPIQEGGIISNKCLDDLLSYFGGNTYLEEMDVDETKNERYKSFTNSIATVAMQQFNEQMKQLMEAQQKENDPKPPTSK